jgi:N-methylhydantoinase A
VTASTSGLRIAVDIGGTFVDAIAYDEAAGAISLRKSPTTPQDPTRGVLSAIDKLSVPLADASELIHGTTLGINAILQRRGALTGIITNEGFRDIFLIARSVTPFESIYDYQYVKPPSLVKRRHTFGVPCRVDHRGEEVVPLDEEAVVRAGAALESMGIESVAVTYLHSYLDATHERRTAEILRESFPRLSVSISSDIARQYPEYERTSSTVLDAYIRPIMDNYLERLEADLRGRGLESPLLVMRSGGGAMTVDVAKRSPLLTVLSGPAGGIAGATSLARATDRARAISFDVGGTSTDTCVIEDGVPNEVYEARIEEFPVMVPIFDIRSIGAGGGSIGWLDEGLLKVGPHSAGAEPGPIAYGRGGTEPTVTDAAIVLGYLEAERFLGGEMDLDEEAAHRGIREKLAEPLGVTTEVAAASMFRVMISRMVGALREITVERGLDPRDFALIGFGGAGPMLAPILMREMDVAESVIPVAPAAFSAWGMLMTDVEYDLAQTMLVRGAYVGGRSRGLTQEDLDGLQPAFDDLELEAQRLLAEQGIPDERQRTIRRLDVRYAGQEHTLAVDVRADSGVDEIQATFDAIHRERYGHDLAMPLQIVTIRVRAVGEMDKPAVAQLALKDVAEQPSGIRRAFDFSSNEMREFLVLSRGSLRPDDEVAGPAIVDEGTSTSLVFADQRLRVDSSGLLIITPAVAA